MNLNVWRALAASKVPAFSAVGLVESPFPQVNDSFVRPTGGSTAVVEAAKFVGRQHESHVQLTNVCAPGEAFCDPTHVIVSTTRSVRIVNVATATNSSHHVSRLARHAVPHPAPFPLSQVVPLTNSSFLVLGSGNASIGSISSDGRFVTWGPTTSYSGQIVMDLKAVALDANTVALSAYHGTDMRLSTTIGGVVNNRIEWLPFRAYAGDESLHQIVRVSSTQFLLAYLVQGGKYATLSLVHATASNGSVTWSAPHSWSIPAANSVLECSPWHTAVNSTMPTNATAKAVYVPKEASNAPKEMLFSAELEDVICVTATDDGSLTAWTLFASAEGGWSQGPSATLALPVEAMAGSVDEWMSIRVVPLSGKRATVVRADDQRGGRILVQSLSRTEDALYSRTEFVMDERNALGDFWMDAVRISESTLLLADWSAQGQPAIGARIAWPPAGPTVTQGALSLVSFGSPVVGVSAIGSIVPPTFDVAVQSTGVARIPVEGGLCERAVGKTAIATAWGAAVVAQRADEEIPTQFWAKVGVSNTGLMVGSDQVSHLSVAVDASGRLGTIIGCSGSSTALVKLDLVK
jgi:hypothetical protein